MKKKKTYTPMPQVPEELRERYLTMLAVHAGQISVSEGARRLGMKRNHFQSMLHRGLEGLLEGITPRAPGRPAVPEAEAKLRQENERLRRENERLQQQVENTHRLIELTAEVFNKRLTRRETKKSAAEKTDDDVEDDLCVVRQLRELGLPARIATAVVGISEQTARRWRVHCPKKRGPARRPPPAPPIVARASERVRELHGLVGADALRHAVPGLSRRQAAAIKRSTMTAMERERIAAAERVHVTHVGVMRGMDQMYEWTKDGWRYLLLFGDAAIPYRTSAHVASHYDARSVACAIDADFTTNGAPLVCRMDRYSAHTAPEVLDVMAAHKVLVLQGPPHHPRFYGQLERQNRDNRAWLDALDVPDPDALAHHVEEMLHALNDLWPRRTLSFRTAAELWNARNPLDVDRDELKDEVDHEATRRRRNVPDDLATRLAIEKALTRRGWLRREVGGWC